jgi:hypothetical protein
MFYDLFTCHTRTIFPSWNFICWSKACHSRGLETQHLIHLAVLTELYHILWSHYMTVEVTPDKELALHILVAEVGTVVGFGRHTYSLRRRPGICRWWS